MPDEILEEMKIETAAETVNTVQKGKIFFISPQALKSGTAFFLITIIKEPTNIKHPWKSPLLFKTQFSPIMNKTRLTIAATKDPMAII